MMLGDGFPSRVCDYNMLLQPIQFVVSTLLQPTARHFCKLDDVADCHEFMQSIEADDAFLVLRAALEYIKLTRSLLRVCDDLYQNDDAPSVEEALGEMRQVALESPLSSTALGQASHASPMKRHEYVHPFRQHNDSSADTCLHTALEGSPEKQHGRPARHWLQRLQDVFALSLPSPFARDDDPEVDEAAAPLVNSDEFAPLPELATQNADNGGTSPSSLPGSATKGKLDGEPPPLVVNTMQSMVEFPSNLKLQFHGLVTVADFAKARENHRAAVVVLTQLNGFDVIVRATDALATSHKAQIITLSLLGNPDIVSSCGQLVPRGECRRLVRSAMLQFPTSGRIQGLGCLALANLATHHLDSPSSVDHDTSTPMEAWDVDSSGVDLVVAAMKRFQDVDANVQAAGAWALASICRHHEDLVYAALDVGGLSAVERCKVTFPDDPRVQTNAELAIAQLLHRPVPLLQNDGCVVQ
ncbi:hypothetical protein, variant 1 [Aphanomyces astaci]|uniref:Uncharacterized protein n=1 Tax=Aphanomyces astaci TaxID=112090 RepID=W4FRJ2_APHAT|nr:hypothetical protein, variant 1 [Aphanomyces astaci]ETV70082.1 hypothetical protein, variant 1 [Aphanomyces astaci]|eukprot:XP_009840525.1 hypothetical protein, variant 1 [Aphanomyces astaci]